MQAKSKNKLKRIKKSIRNRRTYNHNCSINNYCSLKERKNDNESNNLSKIKIYIKLF